jgi:predicted metal-dependent enzyme (double-stranded beta helix superfamily)
MFEVDRLVHQCLAALDDPTPTLAVKEILAEAVSRPAEVRAALGEPARAEIVPLHRSDRLTIIKVLWAPGMDIYPHDHRMWAVIGIYGGQEDNAFFRREDGRLVQAGARDLPLSDTVLLGEDVIHAVANRQRVFAETIHIYGGDFFATPRSEWDPETLTERPYDVQKALDVFAKANEGLRVG